MNEQGDLTPMRPVYSDDVIPERPWQSPKHLAVTLGVILIEWAVVVAAISVFHVSSRILVAAGVVLTVTAVGLDIIRWRRKRRTKSPTT